MSKTGWKETTNINQWKGDSFMLGINTMVPGKYQVGPWIMHGPALEKVRKSRLLRTALLLANPVVPKWIKKGLAMDPTPLMEENK